MEFLNSGRSRNRVFPFLWVLFFLIGLPCFADDAIINEPIDGLDMRLSYETCYSDWWENRPHAQTEDPWFVVDSASPCEFFVGASYLNVQKGNTNTPGWDITLGGYASIFGLETRYVAGPDIRWYFQGNIRAYGYHEQSNNITLQGGLRSLTSGIGSFRNPYAGLSGSLYLTRRLGIMGLYRYFFPSSPTSAGSVFGQRYEVGAFLEFRFLRLYGNYFNDIENINTQSGYQLGIRMYF